MAALRGVWLAAIVLVLFAACSGPGGDQSEAGVDASADVGPGVADSGSTDAAKDAGLGAPSSTTSSIAANPTSVVADGTATSTLTVTLRDANQIPVLGQTVSLSASGTQNTFAPSSGTTDTSGIFTSTLSSTKAETKTITATAGALTLKANVPFVPGAAAKLVFTVPPSTTQAGVAVAPAVEVALEDPQSNVLTTSTAAVSVVLGNNTSGATLSGATAVNLASGVATFSTLSVDKVGTGYTLVASTSGVNDATSGAFNVTAGAPSKLVIVQQPTNVVSGAAISPSITVAAEDAYGNVETTSSAAITLAIATNPDNGTLSGQLTVNAVNGIATFSNVSIDKAGLGYTLAATANGYAGATSNGFNVTPGQPASSTSTFVANPTSVVADGTSTSTLTATVRDANQNPITGQSVSLSSTGSNNTFSNASGTTNSSGVFMSTLASTTWELKTVTATVGTLNFNASVQFTNPAACNGTLSFGGEIPLLATGQQPEAITTADFDGDGKPDLAVANENSQTLGIFLAKGPGAFKPQVTYACGQANSITTADFNNDGYADIAVANGGTGSTLGVFLGNGDGTFQKQVTYSTNSYLVVVIAADVNADGKVDLAVADSGAVGVLLGNGDGTFQGEATTTAGSPTAVVAADFNADGKLDLAATAGNTIEVFIGKGNGTFHAYVAYGTGVAPATITTDDFNGDGKADLVSGGNGGVNVLLGNGDGTFQTQVPYTTGTYPKSVITTDFNADGKVDLAVANSGSNTNTVGLLLGNGDGTFQTEVSYPSLTTPYSLTIADFNGDGKVDLAVANEGSNTLGVFLGTGAGTLNIPTVYTTGGAPTFVMTADVNTDGKADIVMASGVASTFLGNGDGTFQSALSTYVGGTGWSMMCTDFNGDGKPDLASATYDTTNININLGKNDGTFQSVASYTTEASGPHYVAAADFNADGKLDLAVSDEGSGYVSIMFGDGTGTFATDNTYGAYDAWQIVTADFNADGKPDVAVTSYSGNVVRIFLGNGDGTLQGQVFYATGTYPLSLATADLNADGILDLAIANEGSNTVGILLGKGDGTFQSQVTYATGINPYSVTIVDLNTDGIPDLAVANGGSNTVGVLLGNGNGTFQSQISYATGVNPYSVASGDFNGDGELDLVVANHSGSVNVLIQTGCLL